VARVGGVQNVIPIALRRWKKSWFSKGTRLERIAFKANLRKQAYDAVIDGQGLIKSALIARLASLTQHGLRGSFANKSDACGYEWPVKFLLPNNQAMPKRIHAIARTRLLAGMMLGYTAQGEPTIYFKDLVSKSTDAKKIMYTHGTTRANNEWPLANWQRLSALLTEGGSRQIVLPHANAHELAVCENIKKTIGDRAIILSRMGLPALLDEMAVCQGVIGVDSGLSHMAVALGLPHVQIFSQDRAWRAGPLPVALGGVPHQVAVGGTQVPDADMVFQAWQKVLGC
jgi:heptosyltransferase-1